jgi:hypothetical protein
VSEFNPHNLAHLVHLAMEIQAEIAGLWQCLILAQAAVAPVHVVVTVLQVDLPQAVQDVRQMSQAHQ